MNACLSRYSSDLKCIPNYLSFGGVVTTRTTCCRPVLPSVIFDISNQHFKYFLHRKPLESSRLATVNARKNVRGKRQKIDFS